MVEHPGWPGSPGNGAGETAHVNEPPDRAMRNRPEQIADPIDQLILDVASADEVGAASPGRRLPWPQPGVDPSTRLDLVRAFLADHEELREQLAGEIRTAWRQTADNSTAYQRARADRRVELVSWAELHAVRVQAAQLGDGFLDDLATYLAEAEGRAGL
jgi:hypothetical protein